jgi:hypothetical protein
MINLNVHLHCAVPDGAFVRKDGENRFEPLPAPTDEEVKAILRRIVTRARKLLRPLRDAGRDDARPPDPLAAAQAGSVASPTVASPEAPTAKKHAAYLEGFSRHVGVAR